MLGPVYKYNVPYKMASEDIQNKAQMVKKTTDQWGFLENYHLKLKNFGPEEKENACIKFSTDLKLRLNPEVGTITTAGDYFSVLFSAKRRTKGERHLLI